MVVLGFNCFLYYLSTGSRATWTASATNGVYSAAAPSNLAILKGVQDVTVSDEFTKAAASTRDGGGATFSEPGLVDNPIKFKLLNLTYAEATQAYLIQQKIARGVISLCALDGPKATTGSFGLWGDFKVGKFERGEPLPECSTYDVELWPCVSSIPPQWVVVGS